MKCLAKTEFKNKNKTKIKKCSKDCLFLYCREHWRKKWKILVLIYALTIGLFLYIINNYPIIVNFFKSEHDKMMDEKYTEEYVTPMLDSEGRIFINLGGMHFIQHMPIDGKGICPQVSYGQTSEELAKVGTDGFWYCIKLDKGKVLVSVLVKDLKTGEIIVEIVYNKVKILKSGVHDYSIPEKNMIEIIDRYGYVAFKMWVDEIKKSVQIRGYFYCDYYTYFFNNDTSMYPVRHENPNFMQESINQAKILKPFPFK